ncbi:MAG: hypothetical protein CL973_01000 [Euryarchaeota archaeon]|nr:hypothetical protein [Euryarchaeota archaeon]
MTIITPDDQSARIRFTSPSTNTDVGGATIFYRQNINKMLVGTAVSGGKLALTSGAGNETMVLDASGNVGIGGSPVEKFYVTTSSGDARIGLNAPSGSDTEIKFSNAGTVEYSVGHDDGTDNFVIGTANVDTPLISVTKAGNVGIGTSSPATGLHVSGGNNLTSSLTLQNTAPTPDNIWRITPLYNSGDLAFFDDGTERMRIDSSGNVGIGASTYEGSVTSNASSLWISSAGYLSANINNDWGLGVNRTGTDGTLINLRKNGADVGSISAIPTGVQYNTTSDRRLKDNIKTITDGRDKLMAMNPVTHTWVADPKVDAVHGFIAQEMMDILPEAVAGDPEGKEMMSMDYGRITPVIVAALQDALTEIQKLKIRINQLEAK